MSKSIEIKSVIEDNKEKKISLIVDKNGVYEETYNYRALDFCNKEYFTEELIYDATVNHNYVLEKNEGTSVLLVNTKNSKDCLWIHPNTKEFELFEYKKMIKK